MINNQKAFFLKIHQTGGGEPILVGMFEREARELIAKHKNGTLPEIIGDPSAASPWTIRTSVISAIQMIPAESLMGQGHQLVKHPWFKDLGSGVN